MADKYVPKKAAGGQTKLREWWNAVVESNFGVLYRAINDHFNGTDDRHTPLRYNYDKPEKPRISRVFGYQARFFILFQPEKSSREVVIS